MKKYLLMLMTLIFSLGCALKIDSTTINRDILPQNSDNVTQFLDSKTYSTYEEKTQKLTRYYFKVKHGELKASYEIVYLPQYAKYELYAISSEIKIALDRLTHKRYITMQEAIVAEVKKSNFKKLYIEKEEYIIDNDFARDLMYAIREFTKKVDERYDNND